MQGEQGRWEKAFSFAHEVQRKMPRQSSKLKVPHLRQNNPMQEHQSDTKKRERSPAEEALGVRMDVLDVSAESSCGKDGQLHAGLGELVETSGRSPLPQRWSQLVSAVPRSELPSHKRHWHTGGKP